MWKSIIINGLLCGIGLSTIFLLGFEYPFHSIRSNASILYSFVVLITTYLGIESFLMNARNPKYNYVIGIAMGITISIIGIAFLLIYTHIRYDVNQYINTSKGPMVSFFFTALVISTITPIKFVFQSLIEKQTKKDNNLTNQ